MPDRTIVLASSSPRRLELLSRIGVPYRALPASGVDESEVRGDAHVVVTELARRKAEWSLGAALDAGEPLGALWVLGADTVVSLDGEVLGKPEDAGEARDMLTRLAGREHEVITGVAVCHPVPGRSGIEHETRVALESTVVRFGHANADDIDAYVRSGDWKDKAGAYGIQSGGASLVADFTGCYYNVVGLPLKLALAMLEMDRPFNADVGCAVCPTKFGCDCEEIRALFHG